MISCLDCVADGHAAGNHGQDVLMIRHQDVENVRSIAVQHFFQGTVEVFGPRDAARAGTEPASERDEVGVRLLVTAG